MGFYPSRPIRDAEYLLQRAEAEARLASEARNERAEEAHHVLASAYLDRLFSDEEQARANVEEAARHQETEQAIVSALTSAFTVYAPLPRDDDIAHLLEELDEVDADEPEPDGGPTVFQNNDVVLEDSALAA